MSAVFFLGLHASTRPGLAQYIKGQGLLNIADFLLRQIRWIGRERSIIRPFFSLCHHKAPITASDTLSVAQKSSLSMFDAFSRTFSVPSVFQPYCQICLYHTGSSFLKSPQNCLQITLNRDIMATARLSAAQSGFGASHLKNTASRRFWLSSIRNQSYLSCSNVAYCCKTTSMNSNNRIPFFSDVAWGYFSLDTTGRILNPGITEQRARNCNSSCSSLHSAGAAPDISFNGIPPVKQPENSELLSQKLPCEQTLKLCSGSHYLPHPDKEETGGEDAHFICTDEQAIGVADGVGGWADWGIDSGQYARELMSHSVCAVQEEPKGCIDPARVLEKAYSKTKAEGSSTACIIALTYQGLQAINLGDSGFMVVRDGCTIFRSPVQQHSFNLTFQLARGSDTDLPSSGEVFTIPVAPGDVVVAGTDGLFDNLYDNEVTAVVVQAVRAGHSPQVTAQKIVALARQRAQDRDWRTPFSAAAEDAGYLHHGGKLDDITVIVSYITSSGS